VGIIRKTKSVNLLLNVFDSNQHALSVVQLVESTKEQMNKTTVYRVLDRLEQEGLVYSFLGTNGLKWYAKCTKCTSDHACQMHTNFQCNRCGSMECIPVQMEIPEIPNVQINSAQVILSGTCSKCAD
jgi:Fur family ferric uptake transcriptional regulator